MKMKQAIKALYLQFVWATTKVSFKKNDIYINSILCGRFEVVKQAERRALKVYPTDVTIDAVNYIDRYKVYDKLNRFLGIYSTEILAAKRLFFYIHK